MGGVNNGTTMITMDDWMRLMEKRILHEERRPLVRSASDIMGPGLAPTAVQLLDWNDPASAFNGLYWSAPGAINSPEVNTAWMGLSQVSEDGSGYQWVTDYAGTSLPPVVYMRRIKAVGGTRTFSEWMDASGGGGGGAASDVVHYQSASVQSIPTAAFTAVTGWSLTVDPTPDPGYFTLADPTWTCAIAGTYLLSVQLTFNANATGRRIVLVYINGVERRRTEVSSGGGGYASLPLAFPLELVVGDVVAIYAYQTSGAALTRSAPSHRVSFAPLTTEAVGSGGGGGGGGGSPTGPAGGSLIGSYPNPVLAPGAVGSAEIADGSVAAADLAPGVLSYRHTQAAAATVWTISHGLSFMPNVMAVDSTGQWIIPEIQYLSSSTVQLTFSASVGGEAYLS